MRIDTIKMPKGNRMLRLGFGQHEYKYFVRLDLWFVGWRIAFYVPSS